MGSNIEDYIWSSYRDHRSNNQVGIVDTNFILNMISEDREKSLIAYRDFMDENKKESISVFEEVDFIGSVNIIMIDNYLKKEKKCLDEILDEITKDEKIFKEIKLKISICGFFYSLQN